MFVEWRCIHNAAVSFVYTPDESFSNHAIHVLLTAPRTRTRLYMGNTGSDTCPHTPSYSGSKSIVQLPRVMH